MFAVNDLTECRGVPAVDSARLAVAAYTDTFGAGIDDAGAVAGYFIDANSVYTAFCARLPRNNQPGTESSAR